jgi:hypothetical protein
VGCVDCVVLLVVVGFEAVNVGVIVLVFFAVVKDGVEDSSVGWLCVD